MPYTNDPLSSPTDRLRLQVGDIDQYEEGLSDSVYEYILIVNDDITKAQPSVKSTITALKYLVAKYANYEHEEAGDLELWGDKYEQYKNLLDSYLKDPRYFGGASIGVPFAGGISINDIENNYLDLDNNVVEPAEDWFVDNRFNSDGIERGRFCPRSFRKNCY